MERIEFSKNNNVVYYIDEEARTVKAKLRCSPYEPQDIFDRQTYKHIRGNGNGVVDELDYIIRRYQINDCYFGKAKCHPDDVFDVEFGKRLALLRAKKKHLAAVEGTLDKMNMWLTGLRERMIKTQRHYDRLYIDNNIELYRTEGVKI